MNTSSLQAGWSQVEYTPAPGLNLLGQLHARIATHTRDPLMAVAVAFANEQTRVVLVSCDICIVDNAFIAQTQREWQNSATADATLLIHTNHTHLAPIATNVLGTTPDPQFLETLRGAILEAANQALQNLEPVDVFAANGFLDQMGWNRRAMFADGTTKMYGNSTDPGFCGMEGPRDGHLPVLWTKNASDKITGVLTGFATHPNCMENECFYSADLPGAVRKHLNQALGGETQVLYLTGAAGDTAPRILDPYDASQPWNGESGVEKSGAYLAEAAVKLIEQTSQPMENAALNLQRQTLQIPLREWPEPHEKSFPARLDLDYYRNAAQQWPQQLRDNSPFPVNINVLRVGEAAICTNPAELFVEFGLQIKAASPARVTFVSELTDGFCGYVPTPKAFSRGGYETWCAPTSPLEFAAGDKIVAETTRLLAEIFA